VEDRWEQALLAPLREYLSRPCKHFRSRLVELAWRIAGGLDDPPASLTAIVELLHAGSLIIDDIQDESRIRRGGPALHITLGLPLAVNAGSWLYFLALNLISEMGLSARLEQKAYRYCLSAIQRSHEGQALDLASRVTALPPTEIPHFVLTISTLKTGSLLGLAATLGSLVAGADPQIVDVLTRFGERLGVGLQMQNDLQELTAVARWNASSQDLRHERVTWPWSWLVERATPESFQTLQALARQVAAGQAEPAVLAQKMLAEMGSYAAEYRNRWLWRAFDDLAQVIRPCADLEELRSEIRRLEERYV
jgi:geranylgeranyl pyrophosphate synthase